jgi:hypothetical protein
MSPSYEQWIIPFALQLVLAGLMYFGLFFIRESPRWLISRGLREQALKNLCWIRCLDADDIYMMEEVSKKCRQLMLLSRINARLSASDSGNRSRRCTETRRCCISSF